MRGPASDERSAAVVVRAPDNPPRERRDVQARTSLRGKFVAASLARASPVLRPPKHWRRGVAQTARTPQRIRPKLRRPPRGVVRYDVHIRVSPNSRNRFASDSPPASEV